MATRETNMLVVPALLCVLAAACSSTDGAPDGQPVKETFDGPYGSLTIAALQSQYLLDATKLSDESYTAAHPEAFGHAQACAGEYSNGKVIPPSNTVTETRGVVLAGNSVNLLQAAYDGDALASPTVLVTLPITDLQAGITDGTYALGSGGLTPSLVLLNGYSNPSTSCVIAIAVGDIQVSNAQSTLDSEAGTIRVDASNLTLYYPTSTPWGDVSDSLGRLCPLE